jgi:hypothetical protein
MIVLLLHSKPLPRPTLFSVHISSPKRYLLYTTLLSNRMWISYSHPLNTPYFTIFWQECKHIILMLHDLGIRLRKMSVTLNDFIIRFCIHHHHYHHHHHHVHEGLCVFPVPWSSKWNWSLHLFLGRPMFLRPFGLYCNACLGILFVSILCTCCSHFSCFFFISFTIFSAPVFSLIHWFLSLSSFVILSRFCILIYMNCIIAIYKTPSW